MTIKVFRHGLAALATSGLLALPAGAASIDAVRSRIDGYRELGAAFKGVNDALRGREVQTVILSQYARQIRNHARNQYAWFPPGSDASTGIKTLVKPEIWTRPAQFRAAQDAFARSAEAFQRTVQGGDARAIRNAARALGATCKACHDAFRKPTD
ncbi:MAG: cytochrome c [Novosphingobium sp.]|nr:cytochrome c [Novosphingobium sp.]